MLLPASMLMCNQLSCWCVCPGDGVWITGGFRIQKSLQEARRRRKFLFRSDAFWTFWNSTQVEEMNAHSRPTARCSGAKNKRMLKSVSSCLMCLLTCRCHDLSFRTCRSLQLSWGPSWTKSLPNVSQSEDPAFLMWTRPAAGFTSCFLF